ncbi:SlyX family protein [Thiomicrorhabdus chilensis]|uniref:SlyX family protein n=1 Tax=Thiomicrorhabdus chilensis TaxID=63656 RepID=UPI00040D2694|nr:SlyX family protein [Thiomicrorhabdus chilensis]
MTEELQDKLHAIEVTQAFQDDTLEALQKTVAEQHQEIQTLKTQLRLLSEYLKTLREESIKDPGQESPPPHY